FRGTCSQVNAAGAIVSTPITDRTWLQEVAQKSGITDLRSIALVYHVHGNDLGDTIDVINPANGAVYGTLFGFYFGEDFGRQALTNSTGTQVRRLDYIYTDQNTHSLGAALVNKQYVTDRRGNTRLRVQGQMNYVVTSTDTTPTKICTGTFTSGNPLIFTNAP
ncbi:MAG TPA: hypothetical protein VNZ22_13430, partial [Bacillota bacterium]|nr:hypothetical protein [Bacillota bacterium]